MRGIIKTYSFDEDYFRIGEAFHLHKKGETNVYNNGILTKRTEDMLTFVTNKSKEYPEGIIEIKLNDLTGYSHWEITRMKCDYKDGVFNSEE